MNVEELLQELQSKGMTDDDIKSLLKSALDTIGKDDFDHDVDKASDLLGVDLK